MCSENVCKYHFFYIPLPLSLVKCIIYSLRILAPLEKCPLVKEQSASGHLSDLTVFWSLVVHTVTMVCSK